MHTFTPAPPLPPQTEKFFDLTGSITNTLLTVGAAGAAASRSALSTRRAMCACMIALWAVRIGHFLFTRILASGEDRRFRTIKTSLPRFFNVWTLQGLWCWFNVLAFAIMCSPALDAAAAAPLGALDGIGAGLWLCGFVVEVLADRQKTAFNADPNNKGRFISHGLWSWSRHPNYCGEIVLWTGVAVISSSAFINYGVGWHWIGLWSPVFVTLLLTCVSGVPMLESRADKKWGDDAEYKRYKAQTPVMFPFFSRTG